MNSHTTDRFSSILPIRKAAEFWTLALVLLGLAGGAAWAAEPEVASPSILDPLTLTSTSVVVDGNVTDDDSQDVTERGVIFAATEDIVDESDLTYANVDGTTILRVSEIGTFAAGTFTSQLAGLAAATEYTVQAFATNADGIAYSASPFVFTTDNDEAALSGLDLSVGTLTPAFASGTLAYTAEVSNLTASIKVTGLAATDSNAAIQVRINPVDPDDEGDAGDYVVVAGGESADLSLEDALSGESENIVQVRVIAQDDSKDLDGHYLFSETYTITVTRLAPLALEPTPTFSDVEVTTATLGGEVVEDGGDPITRRGFVYKASPTSVDPVVDDSDPDTHTVEADGPHAIGEFTKALVGLKEGTTYWFKAFAENAGGIKESSVGTFTTKPRLSSLTIEGAAPTATVGNQGELDPPFDADAFAYTATVSNLTGVSPLELDAPEGKIQIKPNRDQDDSTEIKVQIGSIDELVAPNASSIDLPLAVGPNIITVRAIAQDGTTVQDYTIEVTRRAPLEIASATTLAGVTKTAATVGGDILEDGGDAITVRGVVFSESLVNDAPELGGSGVSDVTDPATTDGVFSGSLALSEGVTYSARAYVVNAAGTRYSDVIFFTTQTDVPLPANLIGTVSSRVILPGGEQRFNLNLASATLLSIATSGAPSAEVSVYTSTGTLVGTPAALALADVNLAAGSYYILVKHTDAMGANETFELTLDARTPASATPRPDVAVGKSIRRLTGFSMFSPRKQVLPLASRKGRAVKAVAVFSNQDFTPAKLTGRASKVNKKYKATYRYSGANVTAAITSKGVELGDLRASDGLQRINVQIKPKKSKKSARFSVALTAISADVRDKASIKLTVKK